jgi:L-alanine-DL-glutamate epimerase-like enolase superfamily enzyme
MDTSVAIVGIRVRLYRAKADRPVVTSFGSLSERPALIVEVHDRDGARGWGEIWCNFPAFAAEHRARFLQNVVAPIAIGTTVAEPADLGQRIDRLLGVQAIQAGEEGLLASTAAGLDQALWDLVARRQGLPLWAVLGGTRTVRTYASGLDPENAVETAAGGLEAGERAFKVKVGFSDKVDLQTVAAVRGAIGGETMLMVDANQAWSPRQAVEIASRLAEFELTWLEEPIRADEPSTVWREVASRSPIPLSAGENIRQEHRFTELIQSGIVRHLQPDVGKWGGISQCFAIGRRAVDAGIGYSPHWLGGGVGLAISLNLLGAVGGSGLCEIDANPNPLRTAFPLPSIHEGTVELSDQAGFGFEPDLTAIEHFRRTID